MSKRKYFIIFSWFEQLILQVWRVFHSAYCKVAKFRFVLFQSFKITILIFRSRSVLCAHKPALHALYKRVNVSHIPVKFEELHLNYLKISYLIPSPSYRFMATTLNTGCTTRRIFITLQLLFSILGIFNWWL